MTTRSRKGCIDCKQAKVKCDEVYPACGTCARRRRPCRGYGAPHPLQPSIGEPSGGTGAEVQCSDMAQQEYVILNDYSQGELEDVSDLALAFVMDELQGNGTSFSGSNGTPAFISLISEASSHTLQNISKPHGPSLMQAEAAWLSPPRSPSFIPLNDILPMDKPLIEIYFLRHPSDMVISTDFFIDEMNGAVLSLLQQNPTVVGDSLSAIGENYVKESTCTSLVSNRKMRLLNQLCVVNEDGGKPELVMLLLLALSGAELTDPRSDGRGNELNVLIDNVALILEFHRRSGEELSDAAKYFTRGVARQDLLISLSRMQRTRIDPSFWLDEYSITHADRLWGLTASLAPILAKLAALAEDVQSVTGDRCIRDAMDTSVDLHSSSPYRTDLAARAASIRAQLATWRPIQDRSMSMRTSRNLLLHASAWKAAALLYLFRLFNRPGSSEDADQVALGMSYEVMVHITGSPNDIKLSLWPLFVAASELEQLEDRDIARQLFDGICSARPVITANRTRSFCVDQIWSARDQGEVWDWMHLARHESNVFAPI